LLQLNCNKNETELKLLLKLKNRHQLTNSEMSLGLHFVSLLHLSVETENMMKTLSAYFKHRC